jgi:galactokinase
VVATAPGRVNLMGDHTDYTGGWCLPIAIDRHVEVAVAVEPGSEVVELSSETTGSVIRVPLGVTDVAGFEPEWGRYVAGIVARVRPPEGVRGTVRSTVPIGSGLSSSAALEVACALALGADASSPLALAELCRDAEHEARGVPTGLLDQLASISGVEGHALLIDCASNEVTPVPFLPAEEVEVVVVDSGPRSLAASGYATRVAECAAVEAEIGPLRAATLQDVDALRDPVLRRRARHVVSENARVHELVAAVAADDLAAIGTVLDASHRSLSEDYESSTPVVDHLCAELRAVPGVLGVRITGGGWGGCVVALTRPGAVVGRGWTVRPSTGARIVDGPTPDRA